MSNDLGQQKLKTFQAMKTSRVHLDFQYWKPAFETTYPHRGLGFITGDFNAQYDQTTAKNYQARIYDTTAIDSVRLLASSIISGLTPSNSQWFNLQVPNVNNEDLDFDTKVWLDNAAKNLYRYIHSSNYNAEAYEHFIDISIGGMAGLFVDKEPGGDFKFEAWSLHTMYCADMRGQGFIDTVYRLVPMTPSQIVSKFGKNNVPDHVKEKFRSNPNCTKTLDVVHAIEPRMKGKKQAYGKLSKTMPWSSCYVDMKSGMVMSESGYYEMPVIVPRWQLLPGSDYAIGPLNDALPDIKTLNKVVEMMMTNAEMSIAGTFVAKQDGILNPTTTRIRPRSLVFASDVDNIKPLTSAGDFRISYEEQARLQNQIRTMMMSDSLSPIEKANPSATEVTVRSQLIRQVLGPTYARLQSEFLAPLINRCFNLALRDGSIPPIPEGITDMVPEYISPLARAQRQEDINAMDQYEQALAGLSQIYPEVLDLYDIDQASRLRAQLGGVPASVIKDPEKVAAQRYEEQKQQEARQQAAMAAEQNQQG